MRFSFYGFRLTVDFNWKNFHTKYVVKITQNHLSITLSFHRIITDVINVRILKDGFALSDNYYIFCNYISSGFD